MERRKAAAIAGAGSLTLVATVLALGVNLGLFGVGHDDTEVGTFPVSERTVAPAPGAASPTGPVVAPGEGGPAPEPGTALRPGDDSDPGSDHDDHDADTACREDQKTDPGTAERHDDQRSDDRCRDDRGDDHDADPHGRDDFDKEHHDDDD